MDNLRLKLTPSVCMRSSAPIWRETCANLHLVDPGLLPDMGNVGVALDINCTDPRKMIRPAKTYSDKLLKASNCALPFLPPNTKFNIRKNLKEKEKALIPGSAEWNYYEKYITRYADQGKKIKKNLKRTLDQLKKRDFEKLDPAELVLKMATRLPDEFTANGKFVNELYYNGGGIHYHDHKDSTGFLLHSLGHKMNELVLTPVKTKMESPYMVPEPELSTTFKFTSKILQIATSECHGKVCCAVRYSGKVGVGIISTNPEEQQDIFVSQNTKDHPKEATDVCFSPHIPSEYVHVSADGTFSLCHVDRNDIVCNEKIGPDGFIADRKWICKFCSTPRTLLFASDSHIIMKDLRVGWQSSKTLLNLEKYKLFYENERIRSVTSSLVSPYMHYVASDYQLTLLDTRFTGSPVLVWKHQLQGKPTYCHSTIYKSTVDHMYEAIVLVSRESRKMALFSTQNAGCNESISLAPTVHASGPNDFVNALVYNGQLVNLLISLRTNVRLEGLRCVSSGPGRLTVLQQTECGDVFYQDFEETLFDRECRPKNLGCRFLPELTSYEMDEAVADKSVSWIHQALDPLFKERPKANDAFKNRVKAVNIMNDMMGWERYQDDECEYRIGQAPPTESMSTNQLQEIADREGLLTECHAPTFGTEEFDVDMEEPVPTSLDEFPVSKNKLMRNILSKWRCEDKPLQSQSQTRRFGSNSASGSRAGEAPSSAKVASQVSQPSSQYSNSGGQGQFNSQTRGSQGFVVRSESVERRQQTRGFSQDSLCDASVNSEVIGDIIPSSQLANGISFAAKRAIARSTPYRKNASPKVRNVVGF